MEERKGKGSIEGMRIDKCGGKEGERKETRNKQGWVYIINFGILERRNEYREEWRKGRGKGGGRERVSWKGRGEGMSTKKCGGKEV